MANLKPTTESSIPAKPLSVILAFLLSSSRRRGSIYLYSLYFFLSFVLFVVRYLFVGPY